jgi:uncharacterized protein (TIGR02646 family)
MIQITNKPAVHPEILYGQGELKGTCKLVGETAKLEKLFISNLEQFDGTSKTTFKVDSKIYGHPDLKAQLKLAQHGKCCFCEAKVAHICPGDVEHFRPKRGYLQAAGEEMQKPGYYWLTYNWDNLLFCCEQCNRRDKANYFPIAAPASRAKKAADDLAAEQAIFIHPVSENPADFITFNEEVAAPVAAGDHRAEWTIETLQLNEDTPDGKMDIRREYFATLTRSFKVGSLKLEDYPALKEHILDARDHLKAALEPDKKYAGMAQANFASRITW